MEKSKDTWTVLSSEYLHRAPWLTVRKDHVVLPNGNHIPSYYILEYPNWVNTIAITRNGQFVFIRQYRHGIQETSYELCAGVCEEEDGSPMVSAQRELLEETGYGNGVWKGRSFAVLWLYRSRWRQFLRLPERGHQALHGQGVRRRL